MINIGSMAFDTNEDAICMANTYRSLADNTYSLDRFKYLDKAALIDLYFENQYLKQMVAQLKEGVTL